MERERGGYGGAGNGNARKKVATKRTDLAFGDAPYRPTLLLCLTQHEQ